MSPLTLLFCSYNKHLDALATRINFSSIDFNGANRSQHGEHPRQDATNCLYSPHHPGLRHYRCSHRILRWDVNKPLPRTQGTYKENIGYRGEYFVFPVPRV